MRSLLLDHEFLRNHKILGGSAERVCALVQLKSNVIKEIFRDIAFCIAKDSHIRGFDFLNSVELSFIIKDFEVSVKKRLTSRFLFCFLGHINGILYVLSELKARICWDPLRVDMFNRGFAVSLAQWRCRWRVLFGLREKEACN
jgi:hypothetical protein